MGKCFCTIITGGQEMYFEEKIKKINEKFEKIEHESKILVWGAGRHTEELFRYSIITRFSNLIVADKSNWEKTFAGKDVVGIKSIDFNDVDVVVISTLRYQNEIEAELSNYGFKGKTIKFYEKQEESEFYLLEHKQDTDIELVGDYETWKSAEAECTGYDEPNILEKVAQSTIAVLNGNAAYERDSCLFFKKEISFHLMFWIQMAAMKKNHITVVDLGGALGSTYLQNREIIRKIPAEITWYVVEQPHFVKKGNEIFGGRDVIFRNNMNEIDEEINIILFSGVLGWIEETDDIIKTALSKNPEYIIIDRTFVGERQRICIERVPEVLYQGAVPVKIFKKEELLNMFCREYHLEYEFHSYVDKDVIFDDMKAVSKGFVLKRGCQ